MSEPQEIYREIGRNITVSRRLAGISQTQLGSKLGVTFQQIQKYERAMNRIPIDKLLTVSSVVKTPFMDFLGPHVDARKSSSDTSQLSRLIDEFSKINDPDLQKFLYHLCRILNGNKKHNKLLYTDWLKILEDAGF